MSGRLRWISPVLKVDTTNFESIDLDEAVRWVVDTLDLPDSVRWG
ncbi:MAG: hypothetical protein ABSC46_12460 [Candidatus Limnocylindrales bacterium]|jgi:hypothetical protein